MDERAAAQLKYDFFRKASKLTANFIPQKLTSNFGYLCRSTADSHQFRLPTRAKPKACAYCLTEWNDKNCKVKITRNIKPGSGVKRILRKIQKNKKLSNIENKLALRVTNENRLVTKCMICNKSNTRVLKKNRIILPEKPQVPIIENKIANKKRKKNNKKNLSVIEIIENTKSKSKKKKIVDDEVSVIEIVDEKKCLKSNVKNLNNEASETPSFVIDTIGDFSNRKISVTPKASSQSIGFIPLLSSTPNLIRRKKKNMVVANPLHSKVNESKNGATNRTNKKRLSSIKKLIDEDSKMLANPRYSLKNFLNTVSSK